MSQRTPAVSTVVDIIRTHADLERPALVFEEREITLRELDTRSSRVAQAMRAAGIAAAATRLIAESRLLQPHRLMAERRRSHRMLVEVLIASGVGHPARS